MAQSKLNRGLREARDYAEGEFLNIFGKPHSRRQLAEMGIVSFRAARRLSNLLARKQVKSANELVKISQFDLRQYRRVGDRAIWCAMCLLDAYGKDPVKWVYNGVKKGGRNV